jgi:hypothetical protein
VAPIIGDLLAKNLDWPGAEEIADRLQKMLPAQLQGESPQAQAAQAQIQQMAQIIGKLQGQLAAAQSDKSLDAERVKIEAFDAETARIKAMAPKGVPLTDPNDIQALVVQTLRWALQNPDAVFQDGAMPPMAPPQAQQPQPDQSAPPPMAA